MESSLRNYSKIFFTLSLLLWNVSSLSNNDSDAFVFFSIVLKIIPLICLRYPLKRDCPLWCAPPPLGFCLFSFKLAIIRSYRNDMVTIHSDSHHIHYIKSSRSLRLSLRVSKFFSIVLSTSPSTCHWHNTKHLKSPPQKYLPQSHTISLALATVYT